MANVILQCGAHPVFIEVGTRFVKSILDNHMKIIYRCLYIGRPALANPSLTLLTNIVKFHRGILTNDLFSAFDFSMAVLPKILALKEDVKVDEAKRKVIRMHFIKFFLVFIEYSSVIVRRDLIAQKKIISGWFKYLSYDDADTIVLMLETLEHKVLREPSYLKATKINLFNDWSIALLARMLGRTDVPTDRTESVGTISFNFLQFLTSDMTYGIRFPNKQWYLPDAVVEESDEPKYNNRVLLALIRLLKPWEHVQRQDLVLSILANCPELVTPYLKEDFSVSLDPKMSVFWITNILFFSRLIQTALPSDLINSSALQPPKVEVMIEHILPNPLNKSALSKSLLHPTSLVKFNACQIIIFSFKKLETVIALFKSKGWVDSHYLLLEEIMNRIPDIQTIVTAVNSIENFDNHRLLKTVLVKTIALYAKTLPEIFIKSKFTLPKRLATSLEKTDMDGLELVDLRNVLEIQAKLGGIGKWWNKMPELPYSLFTTLLRLSALLNDKLFTSQINSLVEYLSKPTMLFRQSTIISPVSILIHSLGTSVSFMTADEQAKLWKLFDEAVSRCLRSPFKYVDQLALLQKKVGSDKVSVSPFLAIIIEQWKFVDKSTPYAGVEKWLQKYVRDSIVTGENFAIVKELAKVAELPLYKDMKQIKGSTDFESIQKKWAWSTDESILKENFCERIISYSGTKLTSQSDDYILSPIDLFFVRFRLLHEHDEEVSSYLFSKLKLLPLSIRPLILLNEFWDEILSDKTFKLACGFLDVLQSSFTESELSAEKGYSDLVDQIKLLGSSESLTVSQKASLLQLSAWILDEEYLQAQLTGFFAQKKAYDIGHAFERYLNLGVERCLSQDLLMKIIEYALRSPNPGPILVAVKHYVDKAPVSFTVNSSFVEALKEYCGKEEFSASQLLTSLIRRIPVLDTKAIEGFVAKSFIDDLTFLTIVREFLAETEQDETKRAALQPLITSAVPIIVKVLGSVKNVSPLLKAAVLVAEQLLGSDNDVLQEAVIAFVSESKGTETIMPETVSLAGKLFSLNDEPKSAAVSAVRIWSQRCVIWLNKRLAEDEHIGDKAEQLIASLSSIVNKYKLNLWTVVPTDSLNTLLEIASNKYLDFIPVLNLIGSLVLPTRLAGKQIEFTKLLQIILNHEKTLSLMEMDRNSATSSGTGLSLAYIIYTLFNVDVTRHSNGAVQDKVLALCMGTQRPQDMLLMEVLRKIEGRTSVSFANSIYSWVFSATTADMFEQQSSSKKPSGLGENYDDTLLSDAPTTKLSPLFVQTREGFEATVDSYLIKNTIRNFDCTVQFSPYVSALTTGKSASFNEKIKMLQEYTKLLRSEYVYDPEFLLLMLASSSLVRESKVVDFKTLVETGGLGLVICCLAYPASITCGVGEATAKTTVTNSVAKIALALLHACLGSIKDSTYREEDILRIFLTKILFFLEDEAGDSSNEGPKNFPTSVAVFLAQILDITTNPGHFLYIRAISNYVLVGHSLRAGEIPLYSQLTTASKTDEGPGDLGSGDMQSKELVWLADTLVSGLVTLQDVNLYLKAGVFEWLFNLTCTIPMLSQATASTSTTSNNGVTSNHAKFQNSFYVENHKALHQKARELVLRAQEISGGSTALLTRSGLLAWIQCEQNESRVAIGASSRGGSRGASKGASKVTSKAASMAASTATSGASSPLRRTAQLNLGKSGSGSGSPPNVDQEQLAKLGLRSVLTVNPHKLKEWTNMSDLRNVAMGFNQRPE